VNAEVILYADKVTESMQRALDETQRRRELQLTYNAEHGITPETIKKAIKRGIEDEIAAQRVVTESAGLSETQYITQEFLNELEAEMLAAAQNLEFERAAQLRDRILELKKQLGQAVASGDLNQAGFTLAQKKPKRGRGRRGSSPSDRRVPKPER
jgi:excinuclease ABC subunit B